MMNLVFDDILKVTQASSRAALATVIATEGTAPRKEGAKMLVLEDTTLAGAVSIGGCVDAQVIEAAAQVIRAGIPQVLRLDLGEEDALEIGLTCAGALRILVEPASLSLEIATELKHYLNSGSPFACMTVIRSSFEAVQPSTKALLSSAGDLCGSLGDERLDGAVSQLAQRLLARSVSRVVCLDRTLTSVEASEQSAVEVFIESIGSDPDLYIFGAGQVAVPTAKLAAETGFRVHVIDTRPLFAKRERFPTVSEVVIGFPGEIAQEREFGPSSFGLVLTHSAAHDLPVLEGLLRSDIGYIGVLGSARRAAALASSLRDRGFREQDIARLHIPVGLDIGAESAEQLAVAVVAELLMVRNARSGQSLTWVQGRRLPS